MESNFKAEFYMVWLSFKGCLIIDPYIVTELNSFTNLKKKKHYIMLSIYLICGFFDMLLYT